MEQPDGLGDRIRRLRAERGLSLARVAGEDFSRAFLNQVELGRSRPSTRVLRVIADRLGTRVDYLLTGTSATLDADLDIERARLDLAAGKPRAALNRLRAHLALRDWPAGYEARIAAARALLRLGRAAAAGPLLTEAAEMARSRGDQTRERDCRQITAGDPAPLRTRSDHERLARVALREGRREIALEHLRAARVLAEAQTPSGKVNEGGGSTTGGVISRVTSV